MPGVKIYAWGANSHGQTGTGREEEELLLPSYVDLTEELESLLQDCFADPSSSGREINVTLPNAPQGGSAAVTHIGQHDSPNTSSRPLAEGVTITGGGGHTVLLVKGRAFTCGLNDSGQLGRHTDGTTDPQLRPVHIDEPVAAVACGWDHTLFLTTRGRTLACGSDKHGQRGRPIGSADSSSWNINPADSTAVRAQLDLGGSPRSTEMGESEGVHARWMGASAAGAAALPAPVAGVPRCRRIAAGLRHSAAVTADGRLVLWGDNSRAQCGLVLSPQKRQRRVAAPRVVTELSGVTEVACGQRHTVAIATDRQGRRRLYGLGDNRRGQVRPDRHPAADGDMLDSMLVELVEDVSPTGVHCGWTHTVVTHDGGQVLGWGRGDYGQLALPRQRLQGLSLGSEHTVALTTSGRLLTWGWNEHGNCGTGDVANVITSPADITDDVNGRPVAVGAGYGCSFAVCLEDNRSKGVVE